MKYQIVIGDITDAETDAIVNAANEALLEGLGVCGAIFAKAGREKLEEECEKVRFCRTGQAKITSGCDLKAKYIIHTVAPMFGGSYDEFKLLESCYKNSLTLADEKGLKSIAFPCLGTGYYNMPFEQSAITAISVIKNFTPKNLEECYLYCYTKEDFDRYDLISELENLNV